MCFGIKVIELIGPCFRLIDYGFIIGSPVSTSRLLPDNLSRYSVNRSIFSVDLSIVVIGANGVKAAFTTPM